MLRPHVPFKSNFARHLLTFYSICFHSFPDSTCSATAASADAAAYRSLFSTLLSSVGDLAKSTAAAPSPVLLTKDAAAAILALTEAARGAEAKLITTSPSSSASGSSPTSATSLTSPLGQPPSSLASDSAGDAALREAVASGAPLDRAYATIAKLEQALTSAQAKVSSLECEVVELRWTAANSGLLLPPSPSHSSGVGAINTRRTMMAGTGASSVVGRATSTSGAYGSGGDGNSGDANPSSPLGRQSHQQRAGGSSSNDVNDASPRTSAANPVAMGATGGTYAWGRGTGASLALSASLGGAGGGGGSPASGANRTGYGGGGGPTSPGGGVTSPSRHLFSASSFYASAANGPVVRLGRTNGGSSSSYSIVATAAAAAAGGGGGAGAPASGAGGAVRSSTALGFAAATTPSSPSAAAASSRLSPTSPSSAAAAASLQLSPGVPARQAPEPTS